MFREIAHTAEKKIHSMFQKFRLFFSLLCARQKITLSKSPFFKKPNFCVFST